MALNVPTFERVVMGWKERVEIGDKEIFGEGTEGDTWFDVAGQMKGWKKLCTMVCKKGIVKGVDEVYNVGLKLFIGGDE